LLSSFVCFFGNVWLWFFSYILFTFVLLRQKWGVFFIFGPGMYFQTDQVIFIPEWPNGEFVSILY
jgi:hypothetical protein